MRRKGHPTPTEFTPINVDKYIGTVPIIMRSSWETHFAAKLDRHPNVVCWASESIVIDYYNPIKKRNARYYTDFAATFINAAGVEVTEVFEIKPYGEAYPATLLMQHQKMLLEDSRAKPPPGIASKARTAKSRAYNDATTMVNAAKWLAAESFCEKHNFTFRILTEHQLFGKTVKRTK